MTTYAWPDNVVALLPTALRWRQVHNNRASSSPLSGYTQTISLPGMRWGVTLDFPAHTVAERRTLEGFLTRLSGMEHRVSLFDLARSLPRGNAQLSGVTLSAAAAQFATLLGVAGLVASPGLWSGGSFEIDTNADGLADQWSPYSLGSTGAITRARSSTSPPHGSWHQTVEAAALGNTISDHAGIYRNQVVTASQPYTFSASLRAAAGAFTAEMYLTWKQSGGTIISNINVAPAVTGDWARFALSGVAPSGAASADAFIFMQQGGGALCRIDIDAAQIEIAAAAPAAPNYAGFATLRAGDWLGLVNGQLVQAVADATADDAGAATVEIRPPLRAALSSGTAVTLSKPTALFVLAEPTLEIPYGGANICPPFSVSFAEVFA